MQNNSGSLPYQQAELKPYHAPKGDHFVQGFVLSPGSKTNRAGWVQTLGAAVHSMKWQRWAAPSAPGVVKEFIVCFKGLKELSGDKYSVCLCVRG